MNAHMQRILAARRAVDRADTRRELNAAWDTLQELRRQARESFAKSRGLVVVPTFTTGKLLGLPGRRVGDVPGTDDAVDHRTCLGVVERGSRSPRPIALVSHVYGDPARVLRFADKYALGVELLDASWWWPGQATAVLLSRATQ
jgi:hypothetical protein